jgi:hypothetical protein
MKKMLILVVVVLLAVPVMVSAVPPSRSAVTITCSVAGRTVTVNYSCDPCVADANLVRGFGLDLNVTAGAGANIASLSNLDPNYRIYPGQIVIDSNHVRDYNTPYPGPKVLVPSTSVAIEMGSLYTLDVNYAPGQPKYDPNLGYNAKPKKSGTLLKFTVSGSGSASGTVTENAARGGIVMERAAEKPIVASPPCTWSIAAPTCWDAAACAGQSLGDADCNGKIQAPDLVKLKQSWNKSKGQVGYNCCADFDRNGKVQAPDLVRLKQNWNKTGQLPATGNQSCPP